MKTLAQMSFDYLWLLMFSGEEVIDLDYSVKQLEGLPEYFSVLTTNEKQALAHIAQETKSRLLAEPDQYGYTPRRLVTDDCTSGCSDLRQSIRKRFLTSFRGSAFSLKTAS